jgi:hypothetical protein
MAQNPLLGESSIWKALRTISFVAVGTKSTQLYDGCQCDVVTCSYNGVNETSIGQPRSSLLLDGAAVSLCKLVQLLSVKMTCFQQYPKGHSHIIFSYLRK